LRLIQIGGDPVDSIDPTDMVAHALKFTSQVKEGKSEAFTALAVSYTTLDRPDGPNFVDILGAKENLALLMKQRSDALSRLKAFDFVRSHPEQFTIPGSLNVNGIIGRFEHAVAALTSAASRCVQSPKDAQAALDSVRDLDVPIDELPPRRETTPTLAGTWQQAGSGHGTSKYTFTPRGQKNQFDAVEEGLGAARGIAVVDGLTVTLNFQATVDEASGRFVFTVDPDFTTGDGTIEFATVHTDLGILHNHWTKIA
jgi:hypothetical protein